MLFPVKQYKTEFVFKLENLLGNTGLRQMQLLCGVRKVQTVGNGNGISQLNQIHLLSLLHQEFL